MMQMLPWKDGSEDPVSEVLETLRFRYKQNQLRKKIIPINATAPAAAPNIAARVTDIWYRNHFIYEVKYNWDSKYYTSNLYKRNQAGKINLLAIKTKK